MRSVPSIFYATNADHILRLLVTIAICLSAHDPRTPSNLISILPGYLYCTCYFDLQKYPPKLTSISYSVQRTQAQQQVRQDRDRRRRLRSDIHRPARGRLADSRRFLPDEQAFCPCHLVQEVLCQALSAPSVRCFCRLIAGQSWRKGQFAVFLFQNDIPWHCFYT